MTPSTTLDRPPSSKAVLYCLDCDHESPINGDWIREWTDDAVVYRCPDCDTAITTRPRSSPHVLEGGGGRCSCAGD